MSLENSAGGVISFFVSGIPKPAGSKRAFFNKKTGKAMVVDTSGKGGKDWRGDCKAVAWENKLDNPWDGPVTIVFRFVFPRPKSHYGTGKNSNKLKPSAPKHHLIRPDATKVCRAVEDALTGIIWKDDSQIYQQIITKEYGDNPGVHITIWLMREEL